MVVWAGAGCSGQQARSRDADAARGHTIPSGVERDALITVDGARNIQRFQQGGARYLTYSVSIEYPAQGALDRIGAALRNHGWMPRQEDILNPGRKLSLTSGWNYFVDGTKEPNVGIHSWNGQWEGADGRIVMYDLRYRRPPEGTARLNDLEITAIYMPKDVVMAAIEQSKQQRLR